MNSRINMRFIVLVLALNTLALVVILHRTSNLPIEISGPAEAVGQPGAMFGGRLCMKALPAGSRKDILYRYAERPELGLRCLVIEGGEGQGVESLVRHYETGQENFMFANVKRFSQHGNLLLVYSTTGASCICLEVYGLSSAGEIICLFSTASRAEPQLVDVAGDAGPEIICLDIESINAEVGTYRVHGLDGGRFSLIEEFEGPVDHRYQLTWE